MNGNDLLKALSFVDEKYVDEAEQPARRHFRWQPIAALAACFCLILLAVRVWMPLRKVQFMEIAAPMEAAMSVLTEEAVKEASMEEAMLDVSANSFAAAAPMQMTVQTVNLSDDILTCTVINPGSSGFAPDEIIKLALTEEQQAQCLPDFTETREMLLLSVTFLPEDGDCIHPLEIALADEDGMMG